MGPRGRMDAIFEARSRSCRHARDVTCLSMPPPDPPYLPVRTSSAYQGQIDFLAALLLIAPRLPHPSIRSGRDRSRERRSIASGPSIAMSYCAIDLPSVSPCLSRGGEKKRVQLPAYMMYHRTAGAARVSAVSRHILKYVVPESAKGLDDDTMQRTQRRLFASSAIAVK